MQLANIYVIKVLHLLHEALHETATNHLRPASSASSPPLGVKQVKRVSEANGEANALKTARSRKLQEAETNLAEELQIANFCAQVAP